MVTITLSMCNDTLINDVMTQVHYYNTIIHKNDIINFCKVEMKNNNNSYDKKANHRKQRRDVKI